MDKTDKQYADEAHARAEAAQRAAQAAKATGGKPASADRPASMTEDWSNYIQSQDAILIKAVGRQLGALNRAFDQKLDQQSKDIDERLARMSGEELLRSSTMAVCFSCLASVRRFAADITLLRAKHVAGEKSPHLEGLV